MLGEVQVPAVPLHDCNDQADGGDWVCWMWQVLREFRCLALEGRDGKKLASKEGEKEYERV
jgi:hypothetical protein